MGSLTAKVSGEIASFMSPSMTNIKSLKVHFSPKQLGTGDPSPENVRAIEGWDGVDAYNDPKYSGNIVWNQCFDLSALKIGSGTSNIFNVIKLNTGFRVTANTDVSVSGSRVIYFTLKWNRIQNHRYIFLCKIKGDTLNFSSAYFYHADGSSNRPAKNSTGQYVMAETYTGTTSDSNSSLRLYIYGIELLEGESFEVTDLMAIDLDMMFGTFVVDANATTATERINWFRTIITNSNYREYNEGEITTVSAVNNEPYANLSYQWKKLPDEYQEVEWIANSGTQYLITKAFDMITKVEGDIEFTVAQSGDQMIFGVTQPNASMYAEYYNGRNWYASISNVRYRAVGQCGLPSYNNVIGARFKFILSAESLRVITASSDKSVTPNNTTNRPTNPTYIFAWNSNNTPQYINKGLKIYNLKMFNGDTLAQELVPCYRKSDNEIGMYDTVSQTFYTNQGTGEFLKGEDVFCDTAYGGYIDLISGELVEDMRYKQITAESLSNAGDYIGYTSSVTALDGQSAVWVRNLFNSTAKGRKSGGIKANCNAFKVLMNSTGVSSSQNRTAFAVDNETITNVADFISAVETLEQNDNGLYLAYELAEPITHQLTPTQLQSFVGQNNFWSNADYVEIEYDLIETIDIQKAKQKIILNQPHTESVIDDVVNFTTNMKAPLKECKVYFEPIQEGSGDPSPDNVRNITGWDGVNVGLPSEYQEVEYIESTGTQYIITDIPIQQPVTIYIDVMPLSGSNDQAFFVASYEASPHNVRIGTGYYATRIQNYYQRYYTLGNSGSMGINTKHHAEVYLSQGLQTAVLDGTQLSDTSYTHDSTLLPIDGNKINFFMFAEGRLRASGKIDALFKSHARIYTLKVDNANSTIGNFIPCYRKSDNEIGMYDTISQTFYTNAGTGTFLKGEDINNITTNINWKDEVGSVYGGYVDLVKGELVAEWVNEKIKNMPLTRYHSDVGGVDTYVFILLPSSNRLQNLSELTLAKSDVYVTGIEIPISSIRLMNNYQITGRNTQKHFFIRDDRYETTESFIENMGENVICYKLAEPIHYQLTPQQLLTLKGTNNIWSNTNRQTEVKFWTH